MPRPAGVPPREWCFAVTYANERVGSYQLGEHQLSKGYREAWLRADENYAWHTANAGWQR